MIQFNNVAKTFRRARVLDGISLAQSAKLGQCAAAIKLRSSQSVASGLSRDSLLRLAGIS